MAANATLDWNQSLKILTGPMSNVEDMITNLKTKVFDVGIVTKGWRGGGYAAVADTEAYFEIRGPVGSEVEQMRCLIGGTTANDGNPTSSALFSPNAHNGTENNANQAWARLALDVPEVNGNFTNAGPNFADWKSQLFNYVNRGTSVTPNRPSAESNWIRVLGRPGTGYTPNWIQIVESEEIFAIKVGRSSDGRYTMFIFGAIFKALANGVFTGVGGGGDPYRVGATGDKMMYGMVSSGSNGSAGAGFIYERWNSYRNNQTNNNAPTDIFSGHDAGTGAGNFQPGMAMVVAWSPLYSRWARVTRIGGWDGWQVDQGPFAYATTDVDTFEDGHCNFADMPIAYRHYEEVTYFGELRQIRIGSPGVDGMAFGTISAAAQQFRAGPYETGAGNGIIFSPNP